MRGEGCVDGSVGVAQVLWGSIARSVLVGEHGKSRNVYQSVVYVHCISAKMARAKP